MGAIFTVAVAQATGVDALPGRKVALVPGAGRALAGPASGPTTILLGAERTGLPDALLSAADEIRHIPTAAASDSLNVAMAATVALYELGPGRGTSAAAADRRMARP
jgi:TrmH family RNA methyltransferase